MKKLPLITIIIPTLNEEVNLGRCLESICQVDYPGNKTELVVVDGGSTDQTVAIAKKFGARVLNNPLKIRGAGCKIGVEKAHYPLIAFTDADCVVPKNWLKELFKPLAAGSRIAAIGGPNMTPKNETEFGKATGEMLKILTKPGARYGFSGTKIAETYHNPGCNVLYRQKAILKVGNFNPQLLTCEDEELDFRLRNAGYQLLFTPRVVVSHYRRPTYKRIYVQAYRFAIGRTQAIKLHWQMARWFHFVPSLLLISVAIAILNKAIFYLLAVAIAFLSPAVWLAIKKKNTSYYIYLAILACWFGGWGLGFLRGLFFKPQEAEVPPDE